MRVFSVLVLITIHVEWAGARRNVLAGVNPSSTGPKDLKGDIAVP